jgi:ParB-like chromosome segregation protein Spo0J
MEKTSMTNEPNKLEPVENIQWIECDQLVANHYNPNRVMNAEMNLIERSILLTGWIQPILINKNNVIIDGFHRWTLSRLSPSLRSKYHGRVPCAVLDISDVEAMVITVRINRAKGTHLAFRMSEYVRELVEKHKIPMDKLAVDIGATFDEIQLLMKSDVFEAKDVQNWAYSEAWFPAESGRTRLPTLWDFVDGKEVIENNKKQAEDSMTWYQVADEQIDGGIGLDDAVEVTKKKPKKKRSAVEE